MARVAYVMLAHEQPELVARHVELITNADPTASVYVHYDGNRNAADYQALATRLAPVENAVLVAERAICGWGNFGLVQGTLKGLKAIASSGDEPDYVYLTSGSCLPIRPLAEFNRFLDENGGTEFIQLHDASWIKGGLGWERFEYYFPFNFRTQRRLFDRSVDYQRRLKVRRKFPEGLQPRFGSQWWCLTWPTCRLILDFLASRPDVVKFFRWTWIPDESLFQTLVAKLAGGARLGEPLTLFRFTEGGKPIVFHDDHAEWLTKQSFFFARKIAPDARELEGKLADVAGQPDSQARLHDFGRMTPFYEATTWARAKSEPPGQLYRSDQRRDRYPGPLSKNKRPYVMLFGPRPATDIAAAALSRQVGITVFGRVFHPNRVGLADYGSAALGLTDHDMAIRDFSPSLYLSRVINRAEHLPAFEQAILDQPTAAYLSYDDPNCLFVACLPQFHRFGPVRSWDSDRWRLFASLALLDDSGGRGHRFDSGHLMDDALWEYTLEHLPPRTNEIFNWIRNKALSDLTRPDFMVLSWGGGAEAQDMAMERFKTIQESWKHGRELDPGAFEAAIVALSESSMTDPGAGIQPQIRERVARLSTGIGIVQEKPKARLEAVPIAVR